MGGVIGALSAKVALTAGALLLTSRVDMHRAAATIDPSLPVSRVDASLAERIGLDPGKAKPVMVDIARSTVRLPRLAVGADTQPPVTIGADMLRDVALLVDLKAMQLQVMDASQLRRATKARAPITVAADADGCVTIAAQDADGRPVIAALVAGPAADGAPVPITVGTMRLEASPPPAGRCRTGDVALGWQALAGKSILLDLGHGRIWIW